MTKGEENKEQREWRERQVWELRLEKRNKKSAPIIRYEPIITISLKRTVWQL